MEEKGWNNWMGLTFCSLVDMAKEEWTEDKCVYGSLQFLCHIRDSTLNCGTLAHKKVCNNFQMSLVELKLVGQRLKGHISLILALVKWQQLIKISTYYISSKCLECIHSCFSLLMLLLEQQPKSNFYTKWTWKTPGLRHGFSGNRKTSFFFSFSFNFESDAGI